MANTKSRPVDIAASNLIEYFKQRFSGMTSPIGGIGVGSIGINNSPAIYVSVIKKSFNDVPSFFEGFPVVSRYAGDMILSDNSNNFS